MGWGQAVWGPGTGGEAPICLVTPALCSQESHQTPAWRCLSPHFPSPDSPHRGPRPPSPQGSPVAIWMRPARSKAAPPIPVFVGFYVTTCPTLTTLAPSSPGRKHPEPLGLSRARV